MRSRGCWGFALIALLAGALEAGKITGTVFDPHGRAVSGAVLELWTAKGSVQVSGRSDSEGHFQFEHVSPGSYELTAAAEGFQRVSRVIRLESATSAIQLQLNLALDALAQSITVTPTPGLVETPLETPQPIRVIDAGSARERRAIVLPQLFRDEPGLHVQQTTAHQGAVFVRGLTGQQVVTLIDGVRFNNATFRSGPNQYQALIDPGAVERIEVARGPNSVQYGSDSLGGTVHIITRRPSLTPDGWRTGGQLSTFLGTADWSGGGDAAASVTSGHMGVSLTGFGRRANDLRAGGGLDSHAAVTRFLGLPSQVLGTRLQDTAFTDFGGSARIAARLAATQQLSLYYARSQQQGGRRYDQLNGGNGNLRNGFDPQVLDFFYTRYEKQNLWRLDSLSATVSFNRIRDDRQTQSGDPTAPITFDFARTDSKGYQIQGTTHAGSRHAIAAGAELFDETVRARLYRLNPVTGVAGGPQRPRFPNGASYRSYAAFLQETAYLAPNRWRVTAGLRYSAFQFGARAGENPEGVIDASFRTDDFTYFAGSSYFPRPTLSLNAVVSRGFRAPNITDLSQIGLTSNGYEVSTDEAARLGARIGSTADATARAVGDRLNALQPESLMNYEGGLKYATTRASAEVSYFVSDIHNFITKRTLILPPGATGLRIGGEPITFQDPQLGWVRVAVDSRPVVSRANAAEVRISGIELAHRARLSRAWSWQANFFYLRGRDKRPLGATDAPDIEGGIPPATGYVSVRYHARSRWWIEGASNLAWRQDRLSSIELADQRVGAARSRSSIATFFNTGARARGLVSHGVLLPTGETLAQVQDRVLGPAITSAPWFLSTPGYAILHLRAGLDMTERSTLAVLVENLLDRNYRTHGSGIDGPGLGLQVRYSIRF